MDANYDFRKCIGLKVKPRRGDGLLFYSLFPNGTIDPVSFSCRFRCYPCIYFPTKKCLILGEQADYLPSSEPCPTSLEGFSVIKNFVGHNSYAASQAYCELFFAFYFMADE